MKDLAYFFGEFHSGIVNQIVHFAGFIVLGFGAGIDSVWLMLFSGPIMFSGSVYNALRGRNRRELWTTFPLQLGGWLLAVGLAFLLSVVW